MKEKLKIFWDFETLITEKIIRYIYIGLAGLAALSGVISILLAWSFAFRLIRYSFISFLGFFVGVPIAVAISLIIYIVLLRLGCEALLVRFLIYRETKEINDKMGGTQPAPLAAPQEEAES